MTVEIIRDTPWIIRTSGNIDLSNVDCTPSTGHSVSNIII